MLSGITAEDQMEISKDRIRQALADNDIRASIGRALHVDSEETAKDLLHRADVAMYEDKAQGKQDRFNEASRWRRELAKIAGRLATRAGIDLPN